MASIPRFPIDGAAGDPRHDGPAASATLRVACVQLASDTDVDGNIARAAYGVAQAAQRGARLVVLPEKWNLIGEKEDVLAGAEPLDGRTVTSSRQWAREHGIWLLAGSFVERVDRDEKFSNTSLLIDPAGEIRASYRKIHMFDVEVAGISYRESDTERPGAEIVTTRVDDVPLGMTVCYDLRFPELYRILALRGAQLMTVPAAFTLHTGKDHWEVLLRARAIENQCFVAAAGIIGTHGNGKVSYGRSMIVDPWGVVLAQAPDSECVVVADLDFASLHRVRSSLPSLDSRVPSAYVWPESESVAADVR